MPPGLNAGKIKNLRQTLLNCGFSAADINSIKIDAIMQLNDVKDMYPEDVLNYSMLCELVIGEEGSIYNPDDFSQAVDCIVYHRAIKIAKSQLNDLENALET